MKNYRPITNLEIIVVASFPVLYPCFPKIEINQSFKVTYSSSIKGHVEIHDISFTPYQLLTLLQWIDHHLILQTVSAACLNNSNNYWDEE